MPKITINTEGAGIRQSRGRGVHVLDKNGSGFATFVDSDEVTLNGTEISAGTKTTSIAIPANAFVTRISFKPTALAAGGDLGNGGAMSALVLDGATFSGVSLVTKATKPDLFAGGDLNTVFTYLLPDAAGEDDLADAGPVSSSASVSNVVINVSETSSADSADSCSIAVVVEYVLPVFG